jgi:hypothetical protein
MFPIALTANITQDQMVIPGKLTSFVAFEALMKFLHPLGKRLSPTGTAKGKHISMLKSK